MIKQHFSDAERYLFRQPENTKLLISSRFLLMMLSKKRWHYGFELIIRKHIGINGVHNAGCLKNDLPRTVFIHD